MKDAFQIKCEIKQQEKQLQHFTCESETPVCQGFFYSQELCSRGFYNITQANVKNTPQAQNLTKQHRPQQKPSKKYFSRQSANMERKYLSLLSNNKYSLLQQLGIFLVWLVLITSVFKSLD